MMRDRLLASAGLLLLILAAGLGLRVAAAAPTPAAASTPPAQPYPCSHRQLHIAPGPLVSAQTGEHAVMVRITDGSARPCRLDGWPRVTLHAGARSLPFRMQRGGGPYLPRSRPRAVVVRPGDPAGFLVAKYRCDTGIVAVADTAVVRLPHVQGPYLVRLPRDGVAGLALCRRYRGDAAVDPGNRVAVSPVR